MLDFIAYLEKASPFKINMLDLVIFEETAMTPTKWVFTNRDSFIQFSALRNISFAKIISCFLENINVLSAPLLDLF